MVGKNETPHQIKETYLSLVVVYEMGQELAQYLAHLAFEFSFLAI
jgi:hypothetical protein